MSSLKRIRMLQRRNLISSICGGIQSAALDDEGSWLTPFKVLAARLQFRKECGRPESFTVADFSHILRGFFRCGSLFSCSPLEA
jgi:hypothetical protein